MRTILHLSDLHFGRVDADLVEPLLQAVGSIEPDVVIVSGDLTQRARRGQFRAARAFLDRLPGPQIVVPGNHDVPLDRLLSRLLQPLRGYQRWICADLEPAFLDAELAVYGLSSAHGLTWQGGRISGAALARACRWLAAAPPDAARVVVMHHPPMLSEGDRPAKGLSGARRRLQALADCRVDAVLCGHLHTSRAELAVREDHLVGRDLLVVQAGTGLSTRQRGETNSFNTVRIDAASITVSRFAWTPRTRAFEAVATDRFRRTERGPAAVGLGAA